MYKKIRLCLTLLIINYLQNVESINSNYYESKSLGQTSLLPQREQYHLSYDESTPPVASTNYNNAVGATYDDASYNPNNVVRPELIGNMAANSNYQQQFYRYYDETNQQQQQPLMHTPPQYSTSATTQLWSGPPIVVDDENSMYFPSNIPTQQTAYNRPYNALVSSSSHRNSKALPVYNQQHQQNHRQLMGSPQLYYDNKNIVYHRDFDRHHIDDNIPPPPVQDKFLAYNQQQQQQQQNYEQQPRQYYASNINLQYDSTRNDYSSSLRQNNEINYRDHFKRYLENNPRRIEPIY